MSKHGSGFLLTSKGSSQRKIHTCWGGSHLESQCLNVQHYVLEGALNLQKPKWQLKPMHRTIHAIQHNLGNECHAAKNSYLAESAKVHHALSCKVQFATPVRSCFLLSPPLYLGCSGEAGYQQEFKLLFEPGFSEAGSNTMQGDHNKARILSLFIALLTLH